MPWPVSLVMFLILISFMGAFWGLITAIVRYAEQAGIKSALTLPIAWIAFELIRSFICSGFPWAMLGLLALGLVLVQVSKHYPFIKAVNATD